MAKDFRNFDPASARILLVQAGPRVLPQFNERLSAFATDRQVSALEFGAPLIKVDLPRRWRAGTAGNVESPGGIFTSARSQNRA
jgi:hypothetical protein